MLGWSQEWRAPRCDGSSRIYHHGSDQGSRSRERSGKNDWFYRTAPATIAVSCCGWWIRRYMGSTVAERINNSKGLCVLFLCIFVDLIRTQVAVKVLRHHVDDEDARNKINKVAFITFSRIDRSWNIDVESSQRLRRELTVWQRLDHPNILPLYGVTSDFGFYPSLVCPWLENGNLNLYLQHQGKRLSVQARLQIVGCSSNISANQYWRICRSTYNSS